MPQDQVSSAQEGEVDAKPKRISRPQEVDFAIVTINEAEDAAVREVFRDVINNELNCESYHRGVYGWGYIDSPRGKLVVLHASTGDMKGPIPATDLIRELDQRYKPHYLLVLGTAGGIKERGIDYGSVVFSRQVHAGYQQLLDRIEQTDERLPCDVQVHLFDDPVQPPFNRLYYHAKNIASNWTPPKAELSAYQPEMLLKQIEDGIKRATDNLSSKLKTKVESIDGNWKQEIKEALSRSAVSSPIATEIFSGSYLIDGKNSELFKSLKLTFPKVGANEMEAGAIAQAVLRSIEVDRFVGYLVIKGISDVVDSNVPGPFRKVVRKIVSPYASRLSALFARQFIATWSGDDARMIGQLSLVPPRYSSQLYSPAFQGRHSNSITYQDVPLAEYSQLLNKLCELDHVTSLWTFCFLAPYRFFAALYEPEFMNTGERQGELSDLEKAKQVLELYIRLHSNDHVQKLVESLKDKFPHFQVFVDMAGKGKDVTRIFHKGQDWDEQNRDFLRSLAYVTGRTKTKIACHVLDWKLLDFLDDWRKSDHVVINDELLLEYHYEMKFLQVTYLDDGPVGLRDRYLSFKKNCTRLSDSENDYDVYEG